MRERSVCLPKAECANLDGQFDELDSSLPTARPQYSGGTCRKIPILSKSEAPTAHNFTDVLQPSVHHKVAKCNCTCSFLQLQENAVAIAFCNAFATRFLRFLQFATLPSCKLQIFLRLSCNFADHWSDDELSQARLGSKSELRCFNKPPQRRQDVSEIT